MQMNMHRHISIVTAALVFALAGCASTAPTAQPAATGSVKPSSSGSVFTIEWFTSMSSIAQTQNLVASRNAHPVPQS